MGKIARFLKRRNTIKVGKSNIRKDIEKGRDSRVEKFRSESSIKP
jgi:hypothetical protein